MAANAEITEMVRQASLVGIMHVLIPQDRMVAVVTKATATDRKHMLSVHIKSPLGEYRTLLQ